MVVVISSHWLWWLATHKTGSQNRDDELDFGYVFGEFADV